MRERTTVSNCLVEELNEGDKIPISSTLRFVTEPIADIAVVKNSVMLRIKFESGKERMLPAKSKVVRYK